MSQAGKGGEVESKATESHGKMGVIKGLGPTLTVGWPNMHESEISLGTSDFPIFLT